MIHIGNVDCVICLDRHAIFKNEAGDILSTEICTGKSLKGVNSKEAEEIFTIMGHIDVCFGELDELTVNGSWDKVEGVADELTIKLNSLTLITKGISKS